MLSNTTRQQHLKNIQAAKPHIAGSREQLAPLQGVYEGDRVPLRSSKPSKATVYGLSAVIYLGLTDEKALIYKSKCCCHGVRVECRGDIPYR